MAARESWIRRYSGHAASDRETVLFYHVKQSISYGGLFGRPMWPAHLAGSRRSEPRLGCGGMGPSMV